MNELIKNSRNTAFSTIIAGFALIACSTTVFAASNKEECATEISNAEQMMLTANITNDQLATIDSDLQSAGKLCDSGDFAGATAKINASLATLKAAAN